jgi:hypothetical protein
MKKSLIICIVLVIVLILLIPIPMKLRDGGSVEYRAILYKITKYHKLTLNSETENSGYIEGIGIKILGIEIYNKTIYKDKNQNSINLKDIQVYDANHFSYDKYLELYKNGEVGIRVLGFNNVEEVKINDKEQAIERAKREVTVYYNQISVAYDKDMWQIEFSTKDILGGNQIVYLSENGITKLIAYGE